MISCNLLQKSQFSKIVKTIGLSLRTKKGRELFVDGFYGRFLSTSNPSMAIAMIMATPVPRMYISVGGKANVGCGDGVGAASFTTKAVSACDGQ